MNAGSLVRSDVRATMMFAWIDVPSLRYAVYERRAERRPTWIAVALRIRVLMEDKVGAR